MVEFVVEHVEEVVEVLLVVVAVLLSHGIALLEQVGLSLVQLVGNGVEHD